MTIETTSSFKMSLGQAVAKNKKTFNKIITMMKRLKPKQARGGFCVLVLRMMVLNPLFLQREDRSLYVDMFQVCQHSTYRP